MPVLLDIARAPTLEALLSAAKTQGMDWRISAVPDAGPQDPGRGDLVLGGRPGNQFLANPRYQSQLGATKAAAVIVSPMWPRP